MICVNKARLLVFLWLFVFLCGASFATTTSIYYEGGIISMDHPVIIVKMAKRVSML